MIATPKYHERKRRFENETLKDIEWRIIYEIEQQHFSLTLYSVNGNSVWTQNYYAGHGLFIFPEDKQNTWKGSRQNLISHFDITVPVERIKNQMDIFAGPPYPVNPLDHGAYGFKTKES